MQNFMLQQGLINKSLNEAELKEFLDKSMTGDTGEAADKGHREGVSFTAEVEFEFTT